MRAVGLKVLKNKLSEYVRLVRTGETVVAELVPPREGRSVVLRDAQLADVVRRGLLKVPLIAAIGEPARAPIAKLSSLLDELEADRGDT